MKLNLIAKQTGATLVSVLVILLLITIVGVYSVRGTFYTEQLVRSVRDYNLACERANYALQSYELTVETANDAGTLMSSLVDYDSATASSNAFQVVNYQDAFWTPSSVSSNSAILSQLKAKGQRIGTAIEASAASPGSVATIVNDKQSQVLVEQVNEVLSSNMGLGEGYVPDGVGVYRITALGYGPEDAKCVVQSTYMVRLNI